MKQKTKKRLTIVLAAFVLVTVVLMTGFYVYTQDFYVASDEVDLILSETELRVETMDKVTTVFPEVDSDTNKGIIFYPGGKVEAIAYMPMLIQLAEKGFTVSLVEMPFNLAVFGIDAAEEVLETVEGIEEWYLAGHSLGGAMASSYIEENTDKFNGLILMGAYPINDANIETLTVYGTHDIMLNLEKVQASDRIYEIIDGNHAYFGNYGEQEGDGVARISREEQQRQAVEVITEFITE